MTPENAPTPSPDDNLSPLPLLPVGRYRHYKGYLYEVIGMARHSETLEPMVVYRALYGARGLWVRPAAMFQEQVVIGGNLQYRFTRVEETSD